MIELPVRDPCDLCVAIREERWKIVCESEHALIPVNPMQFEVGQCCVVTRRHVVTLLDLTDEECANVMFSARRLAQALVKAFRPLGILTFQNNGVFSGQETPHFHLHVVPRQEGSDWGWARRSSRPSTVPGAHPAPRAMRAGTPGAASGPGLRLGSWSRRWRRFVTICRHQRPEGSLHLARRSGGPESSHA